MSIPTPTQSTPGGCFVAVLGLFPATLTLICTWGLVKWVKLPVEQRHVDARFWFLLGLAVGSALVTWAVMWVAMRMLRSTDFKEYDSRDPDDVGVRWK